MDWKSYEDQVCEVCKRVFINSEVVQNTYIKGLFSKRERQIDVLVKNFQKKTLIVDAKHYKKKVDIKTVEYFIGMLKDVNVDYGIIISDVGFTKSAINRAHKGENNVGIDVQSF